MKLLFDVTHPAHVHLFKHAIADLRDDGATIRVTSREKEVTTALLDADGIEHEPLSTSGTRPHEVVGEWVTREARLLGVLRAFRPDAVVGRLNPALVHASTAVGVPNVVVMDTEIKPTGIAQAFTALTHPFIDVYCTPPGFTTPRGADAHHIVDLQELAYLHPARFTPDSEQLVAHGVDPDQPYTVVRFAGWDAYHDVGYTGFSPETKRALVSRLDDAGTVYVSSEHPLPSDLAPYESPVPPHLLHDLLADADLYVGDSGTMATEAAVLGTPAVRANEMVADDTEYAFRELEDRGLLFSYQSADRALAAVESLVDRADDECWRRRRRQLLADHGDVTDQLTAIIREAAGAVAPAGRVVPLE